MCLGGGVSTPSVQTPPAVKPLPTPAPLPSPSPTKVEASVTSESRRRATRAVRFGLLSTIKTTPGGIVGKGAGLEAESTKKVKLGE